MAARRSPGRTYPPGSVHPRRAGRAPAPGRPARPGDARPEDARTPGSEPDPGPGPGAPLNAVMPGPGAAEARAARNAQFDMPGKSRLGRWFGPRGRWNSREGRPG